MPEYRAVHVRACLGVGSTNLQERPLGDADEVMDFIGAEQDMPIFTVLASMPRHETHPSSEASPARQMDSPLSSLASTPNQTKKHTRREAPHAGHEHADTHFDLTAANSIGRPHPQSLWIETEIGERLWETIALVGREPGLTVKIETFLHGQLVQNRLHFKHETIMFADAHCGHWTHGSSKGIQQALARWTANNEILGKEATYRKGKRFATHLRSAEYLEALSSLPMPRALHDQDNISIVDIVITAGKQTRTSPSPDDIPLATENGFAPVLETAETQPDSYRGTPTTPLAKDSAQNTPSKSRHTAPKRKKPGEKAMALAKKYGLEDQLYKVVESHCNRRGEPGHKRSVYHRIVDIQKMRQDRQAQAMRQLKSEVTRQSCSGGLLSSPPEKGTRIGSVDNGYDGPAIQEWLESATSSTSASLAEGSSLVFLGGAESHREEPISDFVETQFIVGFRFVVV